MFFQKNFLYQQAIDSFETNNLERAKSLLFKILMTEPKNFDALQLIGVIFGIEKNHHEALVYFKKAHKIKPNDYFINFNLGKALTEIGEDQHALTYHARAVQLEENKPEAWLHYGKSMYELNRYNEAQLNFKRAINLKPNFAEAWCNQGLTLYKLNLNEEALITFDKAISFNSNLAEAWYGRGIVLNELNYYEEALVDIDKAININQNYDKAWLIRGHLKLQLKFYEDALISLDKAIELNPNLADAWSNRGLVLSELKFYEDSLISLDKAIELNPNLADAWSNKGVNQKNQGAFIEALIFFDKAIEVNKNHSQALNNRSLINLYLKNYELGWKEYKNREDAENVKKIKSLLKFTSTNIIEWDGNVECQHLLVLGEQGIGDVVIYSSLLSLLQNKIKIISMTIDNRLIAIFSRSFPKINFIDEKLIEDDFKFDAWVRLASLPEIFNMQPGMETRNSPYLIDNKNLTSDIRKLKSNKKILCGLSWKSKNPKIGKNKNINLSDLNYLSQLLNFNFLNLQYGDTGEEILSLKSEFNMDVKNIDEIDLFENIDGLISMIQACDLVISISNLTAHLAGALGKRAFLLVPYAAGRHWYWHDEKISSWYPSITLHSQNQNLDWGSAIKEIYSELANYKKI
jgi:tetratricopeptide (TPR) repeat protein/ADP-heptose:LPS heptosyltransferase